MAACYAVTGNACSRQAERLSLRLQPRRGDQGRRRGLWAPRQPLDAAVAEARGRLHSRSQHSLGHTEAASAGSVPLSAERDLTHGERTDAECVTPRGTLSLLLMMLFLFTAPLNALKTEGRSLQSVSWAGLQKQAPRHSQHAGRFLGSGFPVQPHGQDIKCTGLSRGSQQGCPTTALASPTGALEPALLSRATPRWAFAFSVHPSLHPCEILGDEAPYRGYGCP